MVVPTKTTDEPSVLGKVRNSVIVVTAGLSTMLPLASAGCASAAPATATATATVDLTLVRFGAADITRHAVSGAHASSTG